MSILNSVISAGGSLLGSLFGWMSNSSTNAANMDIAKYQYEKNLEMWNRNNDYNKPEAQMERLRAAGLNPNLVYGSGNVGGNASSTPPEFHAPTMQAYTNFGDLGASAGVDAYIRAKDLESVIKNRDADTDNKHIESDIKRYSVNTQWLETLDRIATLAGKNLDNDSKSKLNAWIDKEKQAALDNLIASTDNVNSIVQFRDDYEGPLAQSKIDMNKAETAYIRGPKTKQAFAQIDSLSAQAAATRWNIKRSETFFAHELQSLIDKNVISEKTALKLDEELNYLRTKIRNTSADTILKYKDAIIKQWQIDFGLPLGLANDMFNTLISGAKLIL